MYRWIWRHLPGNLAARTFVSVVLVLTAFAALWVWIFPWAYARVPVGF